MDRPAIAGGADEVRCEFRTRVGESGTGHADTHPHRLAIADRGLMGNTPHHGGTRNGCDVLKECRRLESVEFGELRTAEGVHALERRSPHLDDVLRSISPFESSGGGVDEGVVVCCYSWSFEVAVAQSDCGAAIGRLGGRGAGGGVGPNPCDCGDEKTGEKNRSCSG